MQHSAAHSSAVQYSVQGSTVLYSAVMCNWQKHSIHPDYKINSRVFVKTGNWRIIPENKYEHVYLVFVGGNIYQNTLEA